MGRWSYADVVIYYPARGAFVGDEEGLLTQDVSLAMDYWLQRGEELLVGPDYEQGPQIYMLVKRARAFVHAGNWEDWQRYALLPLEPETEFGAPTQCKECEGALCRPLSPTTGSGAARAAPSMSGCHPG